MTTQPRMMSEEHRTLSTGYKPVIDDFPQEKPSVVYEHWSHRPIIVAVGAFIGFAIACAIYWLLIEPYWIGGYGPVLGALTFFGTFFVLLLVIGMLIQRSRTKSLYVNRPKPNRA